MATQWMTGDQLCAEIEHHDSVFLCEQRQGAPSWYIRVPAEALEEFAGNLTGEGRSIAVEFDADGDLVLMVQFVTG